MHEISESPIHGLELESKSMHNFFDRAMYGV